MPPMVIWPPATSWVASLDLLSAGVRRDERESESGENEPSEEETHDGLIPLAAFLYCLPPRCRARVGEVLESQTEDARDGARGEVDSHLIDETKDLVLDGEATHRDMVIGKGACDLARTIGDGELPGDGLEC